MSRLEQNKSGGAGKVMKAGIGYTLGDVIIKGISFLTIPIFTRLMSPEQFGLYSTFFSYENLLMIILGMSLYLSVKPAYNEFGNGIDGYVSNLILMMLPLTSVIVLTSLFIGESFIGYPGYMIAVMAIISFSNSVVSIYYERISIEYQFKKYLIVSAVTTIGSSILAFFLILFVTKTETYIGRTLGLAVMYFLSAAVLTVILFKKSRPRLSSEYSKFALKFSLPLIPQAFFLIIIGQYGKIAITNLVGDKEAGIYGFAFSLIQVLQVIIVAMGSVFTPWFFEKFKDGKLEAIRKRSGHYVILFAIITVGFMALCPEVIKIMADAEYYDSVSLMNPLSIGLFFYFLYQIPLQVGYCCKKTMSVAVITIVAGILNVVLCNVLISRYGYIFAAIVSSATYMLIFIAYSVLSKVLVGKLPYEMHRILFVIAIVVANAVLINMFKENLLVRLLLVALTVTVFVLSDINLVKEILGLLKERRK